MSGKGEKRGEKQGRRGDERRGKVKRRREER